MPKRLKELSGLKVGIRHQHIFSAVEKYGLCTIADVLKYVADAALLDISKENVRDSLKRTIENDLRSFIGASGKLGVRYFYKDGETEVPSNELEETADGGVKNKYVLKYYLLGGKSHFQGASLLKAAKAAFFPQKIGYENWTAIELDHPTNMKSRLGFIIERGREDLISIACKPNDVPVEIIIVEGPVSKGTFFAG